MVVDQPTRESLWTTQAAAAEGGDESDEDTDDSDEDIKLLFEKQITLFTLQGGDYQVSIYGR